MWERGADNRDVQPPWFWLCGVLDGGPPMSPVVILKKVPVDFKIVQCRLSILRNDNVPCRYLFNVHVEFKVVQCRLSNLRKHHVALSILRVKGPPLSPWLWLIYIVILINISSNHVQ